MTNPNANIGERFNHKGTEYEITSVMPLDGFVADELVKMGKAPFWYQASKVLKSGKLSVNGGTFYKMIKESTDYETFTLAL